MNRDKLLKYSSAAKNYVGQWWERYKEEILEYSEAVRILLLVCVFLFAYLGSMDFHGFGVDNAGNLYVGRKNQIEVYADKEQVDAIQSPAGRGWNMGISDDDHILVTGGGMVFTMQLDGTVIKEEKDINSKVSLTLDKQRVIIGNDGNQYRLRHKWIWPTITQNGKIIYMAPVVDMLGRISFMLYFPLFLPDLIIEIEKTRDKRSEQSSDDSEK